MKRYGLYGETTRDFLTSGGQVITHTDRDELTFLFPGARIREVPPSIPPDRCLPLPLHPEVVGVMTFPLTRRQFVHR